MTTKYSVSAKLHSRRTKTGERPLYVLYIYASEVSTFPTGESVKEEAWDSKTKLVNRSITSEADRINAKVKRMQADLLEIAASLTTPSHEIVKRRYNDLAYTKAKAEFNKYLDLAISIGEDQQIEDAEAKLAKDGEQLKARKTAHQPARKQLVSAGILSKEEVAHQAQVQELSNLFLRYAGTGDIIPGQLDSKGKPRRDQGSLKHYKADTYKHVRSMWQQLNDFSTAKNYPLTVQSINQQFYQRFGDYILYDQNNYDNHFGSLIKRLKTFMFWCEAEQGITIHPQIKSRKFKVMCEENEVLILSDEQYQMLADFRTHKDCKSVWVKYIELTLFQSAMGLRHSDMRKATWRVEGAVVDNVDGRIIKGTTQKNKSTYMVPVRLNPEWTIAILEKYEYDFNETARSSKHLKQTKMVAEQKLNQNVKEILQALGKAYNIFTHKIQIYKKKWGEDYDCGKKFQYEMHSSHDNRRAFITRMYRAGNEEKVIARMVGTKSLPELRKYQQVNDSDIINVKGAR